MNEHAASSNAPINSDYVEVKRFSQPATINTYSSAPPCLNYDLNPYVNIIGCHAFNISLQEREWSQQQTLLQEWSESHRVIA